MPELAWLKRALLGLRAPRAGNRMFRGSSALHGVSAIKEQLGTVTLALRVRFTLLRNVGAELPGRVMHMAYWEAMRTDPVPGYRAWFTAARQLTARRVLHGQTSRYPESPIDSGALNPLLPVTDNPLPRRSPVALCNPVRPVRTRPSTAFPVGKAVLGGAACTGGLWFSGRRAAQEFCPLIPSHLRAEALAIQPVRGAPSLEWT
jgi:hypothetical protein